MPLGSICGRRNCDRGYIGARHLDNTFQESSWTTSVRNIAKSSGDRLWIFLLVPWCVKRGCRSIVIDRSEGEGDAYSALDPAGVILKSGRSVLVVPTGASSCRQGGIQVGKQ